MPPFIAETRYEKIDNQAWSPGFIETGFPGQEEPRHHAPIGIWDNEHRFTGASLPDHDATRPRLLLGSGMHSSARLGGGDPDFALSDRAQLSGGTEIIDGSGIYPVIGWGCRYSIEHKEAATFDAKAERRNPVSFDSPKANDNAIRALNAETFRLLFQMPLDQALAVNGATEPDLNAAARLTSYLAGTNVATSRGAVRIEDLKAGDIVHTRDNGSKPIQWVGHRCFEREDLMSNPRLRPIRIQARALGHGLPERDLLVSPQQRLLLRSEITSQMFGTEEILIPAFRLCDLPGVYVDRGAEALHFAHILFDQHEIIFAEGAPAESLFLGSEALKSLSPDAREEIFTIFPELSQSDPPGLARYVPEGPDQKRFVKNLTN